MVNPIMLKDISTLLRAIGDKTTIPTLMFEDDEYSAVLLDREFGNELSPTDKYTPNSSQGVTPQAALAGIIKMLQNKVLSVVETKEEELSVLKKLVEL